MNTPPAQIVQASTPKVARPHDSSVEGSGHASVRIVVPLTAGAVEWRKAPRLSKHERVEIDADGRQYVLRIVDYQ